MDKVEVTKDQLLQLMTDATMELTKHEDDLTSHLMITMLSGILFAKVATKLFDEGEEK